jgi:hypothetical protein
VRCEGGAQQWLQACQKARPCRAQGPQSDPQHAVLAEHTVRWLGRSRGQHQPCLCAAHLALQAMSVRLAMASESALLQIRSHSCSVPRDHYLRVLPMSPLHPATYTHCCMWVAKVAVQDHCRSHGVHLALHTNTALALEAAQACKTQCFPVYTGPVHLVTPTLQA